ncbi:hypothetical protein [Streptomyces hydrogenans]|uniref:hypothetical protein n=1 Tax=Streptomyces hydrogenans TaxID=1873719 RepID=UPI00381E0704
MTHIDGTARPLTPPSPSLVEDAPFSEITASAEGSVVTQDAAAQEHRLPRWLMVASTITGLVCGAAAVALFVAEQEEAALAAAAFGAGALGGPRVTVNIGK